MDLQGDSGIDDYVCNGRADEFDAAFYLEHNHDVGLAVKAGEVPSAWVHYLNHGITEGRPARFLERNKAKRSIIHMHIPKTAGSSISAAFKAAGKKVLSTGPEFKFNAEKHAEVDVFSGHFDYKVARTLSGPMITVLRDPMDRFLSYYFYLLQLYDTGVELSERTVAAKRYPLDEFVYLLDFPHFVEELFNASVWQLAYGYRLADRLDFRCSESPSDDKLLELAQTHLEKFAVVGFQQNIPAFLEEISNRLDVKISLKRENITLKRPKASDISSKTRHKIMDWVYLDSELYRWAQFNFPRTEIR